MHRGRKKVLDVGKGIPYYSDDKHQYLEHAFLSRNVSPAPKKNCRRELKHLFLWKPLKIPKVWEAGMRWAEVIAVTMNNAAKMRGFGDVRGGSG